MGGLLLISSQKAQSSASKKTALLNEHATNELARLGELLERNNAELVVLKEHFGQGESKTELTTLPDEKTVNTLAKSKNLLKQNSNELIALKEQIYHWIRSEDKLEKTAIFYDVENLLKGYSFSQGMLANLSLKEIINAIRQTGKIEQIAVQRAYANWSDSRLKIMRGEINELGIDPIQVFGFSREPVKNAADIQLAIDAIDLAYVRSSIKVFAIVSGDGGFSALAKKLHEYGKIVIGCAYQNAASKTFQAVCDDFVWITDPDEEERYRADLPASINKQSDRSDPQNDKPDNSAKRTTSSLPNEQVSVKQPDRLSPRYARLLTQVEAITSKLPDDVMKKTQEILNWYIQECGSDLSKSGITLSNVQQAISYVIPEFRPIQFGFAKFIEYMQYACKGSELCITRLPPSKVVLTFRSSIPNNGEVLPDLDVREIHSVETYRSILKSGSPVYRLPSLEELYAVAAWMSEHPIYQTDLGTTIENIVTALNDSVSTETVKLTLLSFVAAGMFVREPDGVQLSEQKLSLRDDIRSLQDIISVLREAVIQKLTPALSSTTEEEILRQILPDTTNTY
ncbi:MAG: NYN domain-containing protein [Leptolyngbyaceae cyanobacterium RU_5_1]|nr:NYN domain-containing protein [Leptolyngbyaceae cyanobacterium RU_5_1]